MITAGDIRKGVIFDDGSSTDPKRPSLYLVVDFQHVKPGKGAAFVRTTIKNVLSGKVIERTYNPSEKINDITIEKKDMMLTSSLLRRRQGFLRFPKKCVPKTTAVWHMRMR